MRIPAAISLAFIIGIICSGDGALANAGVETKVRFEPIDTIERLETDFPYETEFSFREPPIVGDSAVLCLRLRSSRDIADTVRFTLRAIPVHYAEPAEFEIFWPSPKEKETFEVEIPIRFLMGGSYSLLLEQTVSFAGRYNLYGLAISFGLDGRVIYFGSHPSPVSNCPGHFYTYNMDRIRILKLDEFKDRRKRSGLSFNADLTISPVPRVNETSVVEFEVTTNSNFVHDIQFQWAYSPGIVLGNLPPSWGGRPREGQSYSGSFEFTPKRPGHSVIQFTIFGKNIYSRVTGKSELEIRLSMVFDSTGSLLYLGEVDLSRCSFSEDDPLRDQLSPGLVPGRSVLRPVIARSRPDFEAIEREDRSEPDSSGMEPSAADSLVRSPGEGADD